MLAFRWHGRSNVVFVVLTCRLQIKLILSYLRLLTVYLTFKAIGSFTELHATLSISNNKSTTLNCTTMSAGKLREHVDPLVDIKYVDLPVNHHRMTILVLI